MLTRREFISILMVMGALFFIFQFMNVMRQKWSSNIQNVYAKKRDRLKQADSVYRPPENAENVIICLGREGAAEQVVKDWANYQKWLFCEAESFQALAAQLRAGKLSPGFVVADLSEEQWQRTEELEGCREILEQGVHVVVPSLPGTALLEQSEPLRQLCGIKSIRARSIRADGIKLYGGFLLGGETVYSVQNEEDEKRQDLTLEMPWFTLTSGTKVYMKAMLDDPDVDVQEQPPVLWRKSSGSGFVFVVNGDYFQGITGLGLLSAMLHETRAVTVYPVVNAQNLVLANAPVFANENNAVIQQRYSQSVRAVVRDVIWASVSRIAVDDSLGLTCMAAPQMDYTDGNEPQQEDLLYYLQTLQTMEGEMGLSGWQHSDVPIGEKLQKDAQFWNVQAGNYPFASFYCPTLPAEELEQALAQPVLRDVQTILKDRDGESALIGYQTEEITQQKAVADGFNYTWRDDLWVKSAETALGYTSVLADLSSVFYPQTEQDGWEVRSKELAKNIRTYWKPFTGFDRTTTAQTDERIRDFLALHDTVRIRSGQIVLDVEGEAPAWFLLWMDTEKPVRMEGGTFQKLEAGVWLVEVREKQAVIDTGAAEQRYFRP